ncbi:PREDICTED: uncharacterized protein LOC104728960 [Camelina sativa]|uniref:Uncharacterized protein LOC104728960 n=1 Tax=Camelina sativa TaxID=90675 RepID=A0ABM0UTM6_CAMSA|nr:PREDICTED: uncharacterized protein LOC104728960 [Camelina sativa]
METRQRDATEVVKTISGYVTHVLVVASFDGGGGAKTDKDKCGVILDILKSYEVVSGQKINFDKSSVQFGNTIDEGVKSKVQQVLGITNLGGMGSYLGLHETLGGSKTKVVSFVRDRLQSRTNGWTAKQLFRGGKEVMIKSVATAVPTFVMSCFLLPKTVTSKLTSAVAKFWWSSGQSGGIHWLAWEKLCALLAKQLWRLIEAPKSLFAQVFKGRYYRNLNPMDLIRSYSPSYGWRSIVSARSLVHKGLIKWVGSGDSISIWTDPWIPAQSPRPALCKGPFKDLSLKISHLTDRQKNSWRMDMLHEHFFPDDVTLIVALPLGSSQSEDSLGWHFTKTGKYTVKSGYDTERLAKQQTSQVIRYGPDITPLLAGVWRRGIDCDSGCARCGDDKETINHAIFRCPPARQVWALAQIAAFPWIMWYIWKARNARVFENQMEKPDDVVRVALGEASTWLQAQTKVVDEESFTIPSAFGASVSGGIRHLHGVFPRYRCFVDGSWKAGDAFAGAGWTCSSSLDAMTTRGAANFRRSLYPLHAEVEAFVWAMRCMIGHNYRDVASYTDCSYLVKMASSPQDWSAFKTYLDNIKTDKEEFSSFSLSLISRNENVSADSLARQARTYPSHALFVDYFPPDWLI